MQDDAAADSRWRAVSNGPICEGATALMRRRIVIPLWSASSKVDGASEPFGLFEFYSAFHPKKGAVAAVLQTRHGKYDFVGAAGGVDISTGGSLVAELRSNNWFSLPNWWHTWKFRSKCCGEYQIGRVAKGSVECRRTQSQLIEVFGNARISIYHEPYNSKLPRRKIASGSGWVPTERWIVPGSLEKWLERCTGLITVHSDPRDLFRVAPSAASIPLISDAQSVVPEPLIVAALYCATWCSVTIV